jgi:hypothetical protein
LSERPAEARVDEAARRLDAARRVDPRVLEARLVDAAFGFGLAFAFVVRFRVVPLGLEPPELVAILFLLELGMCSDYLTSEARRRHRTDRR